uniref:FPL domain-containing protein n=1 Tax=Panagrellus redivivus TaxID=6233 RepID=A0A7E4ZSZ0_PANRE
MFRKLGGSGASLWKPRNIHCIDYLKYLHGVLAKNKVVTESNRDIVIEALRLLSEVLVWGDQNDVSIFDFFLERQMHQHFLGIMQESNSTSVHVQLLQTLNIIFENIRNESALYFLLSNNNVNTVIQHEFNFANEDIMAYFISFMKTLSLKINSKTVHFFFNEATGEFPLLTVALKHFYNTEPMVRTAIRTITLSIYKVDDPSVQKFAVEQLKLFLPQLMQSIVDQVVRMDTFIRSAQNESSNQDRLAGMIDEQIGYLNYFGDIFAAQSTELSAVLRESFVSSILEPLYLLPLLLPFESGAILLCPASCFFFLTNLLLCISDVDLIQSALQPLLFGNENEVRREYRIDSNGLHKLTIRDSVPVPSKLLFFRRLNETIIGGYDHQAEFFALLFLNAIYQKLPNTMPYLLEVAQIPHSSHCTALNQELQAIILGFLRRAAEEPNRNVIRPVAMNLFTVVVRRAVLGLDQGTDVERHIVETTEETLTEIVKHLELSLMTRDDFLDLFEEEFFRVERMEVRIDNAATDATLLLPPVCVKDNVVNLSRDLPFNAEDEVRIRLQLYFILRKFHLDLTGQAEKMLPLSFQEGNLVEVNDCIDLSNSDLLMCTVKHSPNKNAPKSPPKALVTDTFNFILAETHSHRFGYGIITNVGRLENMKIELIDRTCVKITIRNPRTRFAFHDKPVFEGLLVFDDSIRTFSAKQRLTVARKTARDYKIKQIYELFGSSPPAETPFGGAAIPISMNGATTLFPVAPPRQASLPGSPRRRVTPLLPPVSLSAAVLPADVSSSNPSGSDSTNSSQTGQKHSVHLV